MVSCSQNKSKTFKNYRSSDSWSVDLCDSGVEDVSRLSRLVERPEDIRPPLVREGRDLRRRAEVEREVLADLGRVGERHAEVDERQIVTPGDLLELRLGPRLEGLGVRRGHGAAEGLGHILVAHCRD